MRNTYFVIGRKANPEAPAEFVFFTLDSGRLLFRDRLLSAVSYGTAEEAERILKTANPEDCAGCEVLEVFARRRKVDAESQVRAMHADDVRRVHPESSGAAAGDDRGACTSETKSSKRRPAPAIRRRTKTS
jgi:hypothetical protein